ncbi:hypothetical protein [Hymenobacter coalescens]
MAVCARQAVGQQLLYSGKNGINGWFYLYEGDRLKVQFSGDKKMQTYFDGPTDPVKRDQAEFMKRIQKVDNVENQEWVVTKEGPHQLVTYKVKGQGDMKLLRYPAPGKETAPTSFAPKYSLGYADAKTKLRGPYKYVRKHTTNRENLMPWSSMPIKGNYVPADGVLTKKLGDFKAAKEVVVANEEFKTGVWAVPADSLFRNQAPFAFQQGDTVAFEITYTAASKIGAPKASTVYVARPDQWTKYNPAVASSMNYVLLKTEPIYTGKSESGSFVVMNDGIFCFYFGEVGTYDVKVVRHLGPNGKADFKLPIEWVAVYQDDLGYYVMEPKIQ